MSPKPSETPTLQIKMTREKFDLITSAAALSGMDRDEWLTAVLEEAAAVLKPSRREIRKQAETRKQKLETQQKDE